MVNVPPTPSWVWLVQEQDAAASCLQHAWAGLADYRFAATDAEPLFVLLATGTEKLLKLTFGLIAQDNTGRWPTAQEMMPHSGWGHGIAALDAECRRLIRADAPKATYPHQVTQLLDALSADTRMGPWLQVLQRYAEQGRFYNLDRLAESKKNLTTPPKELWKEVYDSAYREDPEFGNVSVDDSPGWDALHQRTLGRLAGSLHLWWKTYHRAWVQGACGPEARRHSSAIAPPKR